MFKSARLKLTAWYLLIIMAVSISFSVVIYQTQINEVERFARAEQLRLERRFRIPFVVFDENVFLEIKRRLVFLLLGINGVVFVVAGGMGYFLAGRTLKPISKMVSEQNRFITDSSHELRTPLTSLKSAMEVSLRDKDFTLKEAKILISENILEVNKLQSLSDELILLAQYQKPEEKVKFETVSLKEIVNKAINRIRPMAANKAITIIDNSDDLDLEADQYRLSDLFIILLDNAIKYSPKKTKVEIAAQKTDSFVKILVSDQGVGIDEKDIPHIFDRFYRADSARSKEETDGFGLGLSIAKRIVETHHGSISVESAVNKGSTFAIKIPILQSHSLKHNKFFSKCEQNLLFSKSSGLLSKI